MGQKLFVGRLPFDFTDEKLKALFEPVGVVVSAAMVPDQKNGRSRGFGFVTMNTAQETEAAILKLNGLRVGEKDIWVTEAKEQTPKAPKPPPPSRFAQAPPSPGGFPSRERKPFGRGPRPGGRSDFPSRDRKPFGSAPRSEFPARRPNRFGPRSGKSGPRKFGPK